jgi:hypothetical protein
MSWILRTFDNGPYASVARQDAQGLVVLLQAAAARSLLRHALLLDSMKRTSDAVDAILEEDAALFTEGGVPAVFYSALLSTLARGSFFDRASNDLVHGILGEAYKWPGAFVEADTIRDRLLRRMMADGGHRSFCYTHEDCRQCAAISLACGG